MLSLEKGARRALTNPPSHGLGDTAVAVSPDGRRVASARTGLARTPFSDIYVVEVSGDFSVKDGPRRLVANQPAPVSLTWMPDGDAIIFSSGGRLWRMSVTGGETRNPERLTIAGGQVADPALSRDGQRLAYSQRQVRQNIWRVELVGGGEHQVLPEVFRGNFAKAGERLYFIPQLDIGCGCYHLEWLDLATGTRSPFMGVKDVGGGLSVSSDGRSLLYTTVVHTSADLLLVEGFR